MIKQERNRLLGLTSRAYWLGVAGVGGLLLLASLLALLLTFLTLLLRNDISGVVVASSSIAGCLLGLGLLWAGITGYRGSHAPHFYSRWAWVIFIGSASILMLIALSLPSDLQLSPWFAPFHAGLIILPALGILSLVVLIAGRELIFTWRQALVAMMGGISTIVLALPVELLGFLFSVIVVVVLALFIPGGEAEVDRIMAFIEPYLNEMVLAPSIQTPSGAQALLDIEEVMTILTSPLVIGVLALTLGVVTPLIEELGKALILGVMGYWSRPSPLQGFVWGVAAGIGFAIVEGIANGAMGLGETGGWISGVSTRGIATGMHALTTGLVGLGWSLFYHKKWWALPFAYSVAVIFHGLWNFNIVATLGNVTFSMDTLSASSIIPLIIIGVQGILVLLTPLLLIGIPLILRKSK